VGFLKQLLEVPIEKLSQSAERKLRTILEMLEENLLKEVNNAVPDPEKKNEYLLELMKKKSQAGAGMLKYSQNVLNCVRVYRVVKPKSDLVMVNLFFWNFRRRKFFLSSDYKQKQNELPMNWIVLNNKLVIYKKP
jgi:hypothetical protein